jgi:hypothetical protein
VAEVEAEGIEPSSERKSRSASTCVGSRLMSSRAVHGPTGSGTTPSTSPLRSGEAEATIPDLRYDGAAPGELHPPQALQVSLAQLRQPLPDQCWQITVSKRFNQEPWTWARSNSFFTPVEASRPQEVYKNYTAREGPGVVMAVREPPRLGCDRPSWPETAPRPHGPSGYPG